MNPWELIGYALGWIVLATLAFLVVAFVIAAIVALVKPRRAGRKAKQIYSSADKK